MYLYSKIYQFDMVYSTGQIVVLQLLKLMAQDFSIVYKRGKENLVADSLSRQIGPQQDDSKLIEGRLMPISVLKPDWFDTIKEEMEVSSYIKNRISKWHQQQLSTNWNLVVLYFALSWIQPSPSFHSSSRNFTIQHMLSASKLSNA